MCKLQVILLACSCFLAHGCCAPRGEQKQATRVPSYWLEFDGAGWRAVVVVNGFPLGFQQGVDKDDLEGGAKNYIESTWGFRSQVARCPGPRLITWLLSDGENVADVHAKHIHGTDPLKIELMCGDPRADREVLLKFEFEPAEQATRASTEKRFYARLPDVKWVVQGAEVIKELTPEDRKEIIKPIKALYSAFAHKSLKSLKRLHEGYPLCDDVCAYKGASRAELIKRTMEFWRGGLLSSKGYAVLLQDPGQFVFEKHDRGVVVFSGRPFSPILYVGGLEILDDPNDLTRSWAIFAVHDLTFVKVDGKWGWLFDVLPSSPSRKLDPSPEMRGNPAE